MSILFSKDDGGRSNYFPTPLKKDRTGDCTIRAIAIATKTDYKVVWDARFELGHQMGHLPNDKRVTESYLESLGWVKNKPIRQSNGRKYKVRNLPIIVMEEFYGYSFIFHTSKHWTAIVNVMVYDTWDCREWCANSFYSLPIQTPEWAKKEVK